MIMSGQHTNSVEAAGNGLLHRRFFLKTGALAATALMTAQSSARNRPAWMDAPGKGMSEAGEPSQYEKHVKRLAVSRPGTTGSGASRSPLEHLEGIITPSRLHFERHHSGIPEIDPGQHRLAIFGEVARPLSFSAEDLCRYPLVSNIQFLECSGNSGAMIAPAPVDRSCSVLHGLVSGSEWSGVPLALLLDEAGIKPSGKWIIASGADSARMSRSIPLSKIYDDAIIALYQNGERLRPGNGYPMRLFLPGWEGNASVKWLKTLQVTDQPAMTKDETSKYSDLSDTGQAELFTFDMGVKSLITSPSPGLDLGQSGLYQISGIAWSGAGRIKRVEVSTDAGKSWADAHLDAQLLPKSLTRFRAAWRWQGRQSILLSRAIDETGQVQPTRTQVLQGRATGSFYHYNGIQAWQVETDGKLRNVYV